MIFACTSTLSKCVKKKVEKEFSQLFLHVINNGDVLECGRSQDKEMPNHVEIRFFLGVKSSPNCITKSSSYHETPENWRCLTDNGRNDS